VAARISLNVNNVATLFFLVRSYRALYHIVSRSALAHNNNQYQAIAADVTRNNAARRGILAIMSSVQQQAWDGNGINAYIGALDNSAAVANNGDKRRPSAVVIIINGRHHLQRGVA